MEHNELLLDLVTVVDKGQELIPYKDYEIKQDGEKFYLVKKKKEYPKTYDECCKIMQVARSTIWFDYDDVRSISKEGDEYEIHIENTLCAFRKLLICHDAYWKLYGEQMGLGKPWKPDWTSDDVKYTISIIEGILTRTRTHYDGTILAFPTTEMRDAFYENFKELIHECKELL